MQPTIAKSELIAALVEAQPDLDETDVESAVNCILETMANALSSGDRIEIRRFGSWALKYRPPKIGRNPKSGESVNVPEKFVPHFKPGAVLRRLVNK